MDGDSHTDLQEFLAGTDPTNKGSILRVLTVTSLSGGGMTIYWSAVPGKTYRVQFKNDLNYSYWNTLAEDVTATGLTGSQVDPYAYLTNHRFYRVVQAQP